MENIEDFKSKYKQRIVSVAKSKTAWLKDFVEAQKPKPPVKTVRDMYKELNKKENESNRHIKAAHKQ